MHKFLSILLLFSCSLLSAQTPEKLQHIYGQLYYNTEGDFIGFISDSVLVSSLNSDGDTAKYNIVRDTIFARQTFRFSDGNGYGTGTDVHYYLLKRTNPDAIVMKAHGAYDRDYNQHLSEQTYYNSERLKESTKGFKYAQLELTGPWNGYTQIKLYANGDFKLFLDSSNAITNYKKPERLPPVIKDTSISKEDMKRFMDILENAQLSRLNKEDRMIIDKRVVDLMVRKGIRTKRYRDCGIRRPQQPLTDYLEYLERKYLGLKERY